MSIDGNLYALNKHLWECEQQEARYEAIEEKANEVKDILMSVNHKFEKAFVLDSKGNKCEMSDFIADMDISDCLFAEFLDGGTLLKDKLNAQFDVFCEEIATDLIDNMDAESCYDTREEYERDM